MERSLAISQCQLFGSLKTKSVATQCAEKILNKFAKKVSKTFAELKCMLQRVRIYIYFSRFKGMESTTLTAYLILPKLAESDKLSICLILNQ